MPIEVISKIVPKNDAFTGLIDQVHVIGSSARNWHMAYNNWTNSNRPHGIQSLTASTLTFNNSTRTLSLTASTPYNYYIKNVKYSTTSRTAQINATSGDYFVYFNSNGSVTSSTIQWDLLTVVPIANVYWNGTQGLLHQQRHGIDRDPIMHEWAHRTINTRIVPGGMRCNFESARNNRGFTARAGTIYDQDLKFDIAQQTNCRIFYRNGPGQGFNFTSLTSTIAYAPGNNLSYDNNGVITTVSVNNYVAYWVFATNNKDCHIYSFMGQRQDNLIRDARRNNTPSSMLFPSFPTRQMKLLYRVLYKKTGGGFAFEQAQDFRDTALLPTGGSFGAIYHDTLIGLNTASHSRYLTVDGSRPLTSNWNADGTSATPLYVDKTNSKTIIGSSASTSNYKLNVNGGIEILDKTTKGVLVRRLGDGASTYKTLPNYDSSTSDDVFGSFSNISQGDLQITNFWGVDVVLDNGGYAYRQSLARQSRIPNKVAFNISRKSAANAVTPLFTVVGRTGNVGIGTTRRSQLLTVSGVAMFGNPNVSEVLLGLDPNTSGHQGIGIWHDGTKGYISCVDQGAAWHDIQIKCNNLDIHGGALSANNIYLKSDGNVGIGTNIPRTKLQISGQTLITNRGDGTASLQLGAAAGNYVGIDADISGSLFIYTSGTSAWSKKITLLKNGNFGIGPTSPDYPLHISATSEWWGANLQNTYQYGAGVYIKGGGNDVGYTMLQLDTYDGQTKFKINGLGNVGIGTTRRSQLLTVSGVAMFGNPNVSEVLLGLDPNTSGHQGIGMWHDGTKGYISCVDQGAAWHDIQIKCNNLDIHGGALSANNIYLKSDGNVGIGMSNPVKKLQINGSVKLGTTSTTYHNFETLLVGQRPRADGYSTIHLAPYTGINRGYHLDCQDTGGNNYHFNIYDAASGAQRLYINNLGYVGLNNSSPSATLHVSGPRIIGDTTNNWTDALPVNYYGKFLGVAPDAGFGAIAYIPLCCTDVTSAVYTGFDGVISYYRGNASAGLSHGMAQISIRNAYNDYRITKFVSSQGRFKLKKRTYGGIQYVMLYIYIGGVDFYMSGSWRGLSPTIITTRLTGANKFAQAEAYIGLSSISDLSYTHIHHNSGTYGASGFVGFGTTNPQSRVHISTNNSSSAVYLATTLTVQNDNDCYITLQSLSGKKTGIIFANPNDTSRRQLYYDDSVRQIIFGQDTKILSGTKLIVRDINSGGRAGYDIYIKTATTNIAKFDKTSRQSTFYQDSYFNKFLYSSSGIIYDSRMKTDSQSLSAAGFAGGNQKRLRIYDSIYNPPQNNYNSYPTDIPYPIYISKHGRICKMYFADGSITAGCLVTSSSGQQLRVKQISTTAQNVLGVAQRYASDAGQVLVAIKGTSYVYSYNGISRGDIVVVDQTKPWAVKGITSNTLMTLDYLKLKLGQCVYSGSSNSTQRIVSI